jgi:hypothetical protein
MKKYVFGILVLLIVITACKHERQEPVAQSTTATTSTTTRPTNDSVCFNTQIQPLFNSSCAMSGCHDAITSAEGYNLTNYAGIKIGIIPGKPSDGVIMKEINRNNMPEYPLPPLDAPQKALLVKWINEGATNRQCVDECNPTNATFAAGVNPTVKTYCVGCHNNSLPSGGINLTTYNLIKASVTSGKFLCSIQHGAGCSSMPKNAGKLNINCITLIQNWIDNGALDN